MSSNQYAALEEAIKKLKQQGVPEEEIKRQSLEAGWTEDDLRPFLGSTKQNIPSPIPSPNFGSKDPLTTSRVNLEKESSSHLVRNTIIVVTFLILILGGATTWAYLNDIGPFSNPPYTESDLISGVLAKIATIDSSEYSINVSAHVENRDLGAVPYDFTISDEKFNTEAPKNFFESASDALTFVSSDFKVNGNMVVAVDTSPLAEQDFSNWSVALAGEGDFSDLAYKVNVELRRIGSVFYGRINNLPAFPFFPLPPKGEWFSWSLGGDSNSFATAMLEGVAKNYKDEKEKFISSFRDIAQVADQERLFVFEQKPKKESKNDRSLYRYNLKVRKEALLPFYRKLAEISKGTDINTIFDEEYLSYFDSEEFDQIVNYYNDNADIVLWVDEKGFPVTIEHALRIIPPDSNQYMLDKQVKVVIGVSLNKINQEINIEAPANSRSLDEIYGNFGNGAFGE